MSLFNVPGYKKGYKGLQQNIDFPVLPKEYCHALQNIDVDDPVGTMKVRGGSSKLHENADDSEFTTIISSYEHRFNGSSSTRIIVNDAGTLKVSSDAGANWADLTLPTGAVLASGFENQYFGWKDHVLITTGSGSTNYVLWYGYIYRQIAQNEGLFNNQEEFTGYDLLRSQLVFPHGMLSELQYTSATYLGGYWYIPMRMINEVGSKWIEKRDSSFRFVEMLEPYAEISDYTQLSLCNDGTNIFIGSDDGVYKINPDTWELVASITTPNNVKDICCDNNHVYTISTTRVDKIQKSDLTIVGTDANGDAAGRITCTPTEASGILYVYIDTDFVRRTKADITTDTHSLSRAGILNLHYDSYNDVVLGARPGPGYIYILDKDDITENSVETYVDAPSVFLDNGTSVRVFSESYGIVQDYDGYTVRYPDFLSICYTDYDSAFGNIEVGTTFYKLSIVDIDGQEYTLSDFIRHSQDAVHYNKLRITADKSYLVDFYRIKALRIYRAFTDTEDSDVPGTDYKFLKEIDINDSGWVDDSDRGIYYIDYRDNTAEATISDVTFLENSGIGDAVKSRYINGKYFTWLDKQLYLANYSHDGDNYPHGFVRSPLNQPDNLSFYDPMGYESGFGEPIKDIGNTFGRVIVFKTRSMALYYDGARERDFPHGLSSEGGFTKVNEEVYFVSDKGIHVFNGTAVITIGDPVVTYFDAVSSLANVSVFFLEGKDRLLFSFRNDRVLVHNVKHKTWTKYSSAFAFRGFYKNYSNEYISWDADTFYKILDGSTKDLEDAGGGNGTAVACIYESPLLKFSGYDGELVTLIGTRQRYLRNSGDTCNLKIYEYGDSAKTLKETIVLGATGTNVNAVRAFISSLLGESYSFRIEITTPTDTANDDAVFENHGYSIEYVGGGYKA